jgi:hypothetical protein
MSRSLKFLGVLGLYMVITLSVAHAVIEGGDDRAGRELAKTKCKTCHVQGKEGGTMTPLSKTQRQWERFFMKKKHEKIAPGALSSISEDELKDIMQFMYNHAADSPQPETCGQ